MANRPNERILRAAHLSNEISTATEQLAVGLNQAVSPIWQARQPGAVFTQLSQGIERLLKLTYMLAEESAGRQVDPKFGAGAAGHGIRELNARVFSFLVSASAPPTSYLGGLVAQSIADPYWSDVLAALDHWASTSGRYRDLDALRGKAAQGDPSWAPWEEAEHRAISEAGGWGNLSDEAIEASRLRVLLSIMLWWHMLYRCWQHGTVGEEGRTFSSAVNPQNLFLDDSIAALIAGR